jgi:hypothetical protein
VHLGEIPVASVSGIVSLVMVVWVSHAMIGLKFASPMYC